jgi:hypothetical protein
MPSLGWAFPRADLSANPGIMATVRTSREGDGSLWVLVPAGHEPAAPGGTAKGTGDARVNSWAAPGTGSDAGALAGPDARRRRKDWQVVSSSTTSFTVTTSAMGGISHTRVKTYW